MVEVSNWSGKIAKLELVSASEAVKICANYSTLKFILPPFEANYNSEQKLKN